MSQPARDAGGHSGANAFSTAVLGEQQGSCCILADSAAHALNCQRCLAPPRAAIWEHLGRLTDQQKSLIEERIKAAGNRMARAGQVPGYKAAEYSLAPVQVRRQDGRTLLRRATKCGLCVSAVASGALKPND